MYKFSKIIAWAYLVVGIVFLVEVVLNWNVDKQKAMVSGIMAVLAVFMFVFKLKYKNKRFNS